MSHRSTYKGEIVEKLLAVLEMEDKALIEYLKGELLKHYPEIVTDHDNYIVATGPNTMALVAHMDTVRRTDAVNIVQYRNLIWNTTGVLGADDRAGVFGILEVVEHCVKNGIPLPTVIFTNYEESGGRGVSKLLSDKALVSDHIHMFLELDRQGCNDYVFYSLSLPKECKQYVECFGFKESHGSYSDISDLSDELLIPSVNLSIGYYRQHSASEVLHIDEMYLTINRVIDMLQDPVGALFPLAKPNYKRGHGFSSKYWGGGMYGNQWDDWADDGYTKKTTATTNLPAKVIPLVNAGGTINQDKLEASKLPVKDISSYCIAIMKLRGLKSEVESALVKAMNLDLLLPIIFGEPECGDLLALLEDLETSYVYYYNHGFGSDDCFTKVWDEIIGAGNVTPLMIPTMDTENEVFV
jgi:hypothetical protein